MPSWASPRQSFPPPPTPPPGQHLPEKAAAADGTRGEMEVTEGYEARGVPDTSATDGDDRDDGATDLASYERAASMAELLARLGESQEVQAIGARAGARSGAASHLMLGRQHRERVRRGQAGPEWGVQWGLHSDSSGLGWGDRGGRSREDVEGSGGCSPWRVGGGGAHERC